MKTERPGAMEETDGSTPLDWRHWAALGAIILMGIAFRAYNLPSQSVWYDEYLSAGYLDRPDLISCLRDQRGENWEMVPLYYTIEYYWARLVGGSMTGVRCLSVLFGILAMALVYGLGKKLCSPRVGLFAALCTALSPFHVFHAQGIRPYALFEVLALASAYAFWEAVNGNGRRWWVVSVSMNLLLFWTHLFSVFVLLPQGCFLLLFRRRPFRRVLAWGAVHLLLLAPVALWVATIRFVPNRTQAWYTGFLVDYILLAPFAMAAFCPAKGRRMEAASFLCLWWLVPGIALLALTVAWTNCVLDRYVIYCWPAAYILVCGVICGIRRPVLRAGATGALVLVVGFQAWQSLGVPTRTDYLSAARLIRENSAPSDTIIVHTRFQVPILAFNMHVPASALKYSVDLRDLRAKTDAELSRGKSVWVVVVGEPGSEETTRGYEQCLADGRTRFAKAVFQGMQAICVYHCVPAKPDETPVSGAEVSLK
jgi:hypothetical protein